MGRSKEVLGAYWRQGLKELGSVAYGSGTAAQQPEYGMIGTKLPSEVAEGRRDEREQEREQERETPDLDRD